jgi:hypothetical protein
MNGGCAFIMPQIMNGAYIRQRASGDIPASFSKRTPRSVPPKTALISQPAHPDAIRISGTAFTTIIFLL